MESLSDEWAYKNILVYDTHFVLLVVNVMLSTGCCDIYCLWHFYTSLTLNIYLISFDFLNSLWIEHSMERGDTATWYIYYSNIRINYHDNNIIQLIWFKRIKLPSFFSCIQKSIKYTTTKKGQKTHIIKIVKLQMISSLECAL